ncbi:MAG: YchJ family protein [Planctomycetota bacterium]
MDSCPCTSGSPYETCCARFIDGGESPATPEMLMRSRYTGYVRGNLPYLERTMHASTRQNFDAEKTSEWSRNSNWISLEIVSTDGGGLGDDDGTVEFIARYETDGDEIEHHELSEFKREEGRWYFLDGKLVAEQPIEREAPKVGRNDPCPCGSGKKFKRCCA